MLQPGSYPTERYDLDKLHCREPDIPAVEVECPAGILHAANGIWIVECEQCGGKLCRDCDDPLLCEQCGGYICRDCRAQVTDLKLNVHRGECAEACIEEEEKRDLEERTGQ